MSDSKKNGLHGLIAWVDTPAPQPSSESSEETSAESSEKTPSEAPEAPAEPTDPEVSAPHRLTVVEDTELTPVDGSASDDDESAGQGSVAPVVNDWSDLFAMPAPEPVTPQEATRAAPPVEEAPVAPRRRQRARASAPAAPPKKKRTPPMKTRRAVPGWVKPTAVVVGIVVLVGLVTGAIVFGRSSLGEDYSAEHSAPADPTLDSSAGQAAATTTRDRLATDMPKDSVTIVSDGCDVKKGESRMPPSQRNLRSAYITFQNEYAARNAEGIRALILPENKAWRDQDWNKTLSELPEDYSYCMTMGPASGTKATASIRMHMNGQDMIAEQTITGRADKDGRWFIQKIEAK